MISSCSSLPQCHSWSPPYFSSKVGSVFSTQWPGLLANPWSSPRTKRSVPVWNGPLLSFPPWPWWWCASPFCVVGALSGSQDSIYVWPCCLGLSQLLHLSAHDCKSDTCSSLALLTFASPFTRWIRGRCVFGLPKRAFESWKLSTILFSDCSPVSGDINHWPKAEQGLHHRLLTPRFVALRQGRSSYLANLLRLSETTRTTRSVQQKLLAVPQTSTKIDERAFRISATCRWNKTSPAALLAGWRWFHDPFGGLLMFSGWLNVCVCMPLFPLSKFSRKCKGNVNKYYYGLYDISRD